MFNVSLFSQLTNNGKRRNRRKHPRINVVPLGLFIAGTTKPFRSLVVAFIFFHLLIANSNRARPLVQCLFMDDSLTQWKHNRHGRDIRFFNVPCIFCRGECVRGPHNVTIAPCIPAGACPCVKILRPHTAYRYQRGMTRSKDLWPKINSNGTLLKQNQYLCVLVRHNLSEGGIIFQGLHQSLCPTALFVKQPLGHNAINNDALP